MCACINNFGGHRTEFTYEARMLGAKIAAPCVNTVGALAATDPDTRADQVQPRQRPPRHTVSRLEQARADTGPHVPGFRGVVGPSLEQLTLHIRVALRFTGAETGAALEAHSAGRPIRNSPQLPPGPSARKRSLPARAGAGTGSLSPPKPRTTAVLLDTAPLADAFDEWELLLSPLLPLPVAHRRGQPVRGVLARDLPEHTARSPSSATL